MIRVVDKLLLFLYSIIIAITAVIMTCVGFGWINKTLADDAIAALYSNQNLYITLGIIGIILFLISIRFFVVSLSRNTLSTQSIDQRTEFGDIRISIETMENLALKAALRQRNVKDLRARVHASDTGLDIVLRAVVDGEASIPALTEERRKELVKRCNGEGENAKVAVRNIRRDAIENIKKLQKEGLSEDEAKDGEKEVQDITDRFTSLVEKHLVAKEKEIMLV